LEDGVILAKRLRDLPSVDDAYRVYQQLRVERIKQLLNLTQTPVRTLDEAKENAKPNTRAFLYAHEIDWDTPLTRVETPSL
jgi:FAD-dependent urate hydroxylase